MSKPTFQPRSPKGKLLPAVEYTALIYIAGTETHRFALHKSLNRALPDELKQWEISEPITGAHVRTVLGSYKGVPVSSRGMTTARARQAAVETLDAFLEQIGSDKFNTTIAAAKAKEQANAIPSA